MLPRPSRSLALLVFVLLLSPLLLLAQTATGTLRGQVTDPSGALVPNATVTVASVDGKSVSTVSDRQGGYEIRGLAPGSYTVSAAATDLTFLQPDVTIAAGQAKQLNLMLEIAVQEERVEVQERAPGLDITPTENASAIVIRGADLDALPDDPDELLADLQALAGPSVGPNGGQIYIDGFTGGELPPKSSIREIRINQNPFAAEFDKVGYGRIEIFTKPGTDKLHGQMMFNLNDSAFNSRNPYLYTAQPGYNSEMYSANVSGPISKNSSFFFNAERRNINDYSIVNTTGIGCDGTIGGNCNLAQPTSRIRTTVSPRIDYQLTPSNTLTARYQFTQTSQNNVLSSTFLLPSQGYNELDTEHRIQISDTQVLSPRVINETRFQFTRTTDDQTAQHFSLASPTISVPSAFTYGGSSFGRLLNDTNAIELQNHTSFALSKHMVKFGGRLRVSRLNYTSDQNFNGSWLFASLADFTAGKASQYSITRGTPAVRNTWADGALYVQDDWRFRPSITLSYGLRYETQNLIGDHGDFAPRLGVAWGLDGKGKKSPKTVLRAGFGIFYDRFDQNLALQVDEFNGVNRQQYVVSDPTTYPNPPALTSTVSPTLYTMASNLRAPYVVQTAVGLERQISKAATVSLTYLNSRGVHQFVLLDVNAPSDPFNASSPRALAAIYGNSNVFQYTSEGTYKQNQLIANYRISVTNRVSLFGFYSLNFANSNTSGSSGVPQNSFNLAKDYGRASFDVRHRLFLGGNLSLPHAVNLSPFMLVMSGSPYNVYLGRDYNGDSVLSNDRPGFVTSQTDPANIVKTALGEFDMAPTAANIIPVNYFTGPTEFTFNLRVAKTFGFGRRTDGSAGGPPPGGGGPPPGGGRGGPGGGPPGGGLGPAGLSSAGGRHGPGWNKNVSRRYNLTISASARNLFNRVNPGTPVANLSVPQLVGTYTTLAGGPFSSSGANRRIDLQMRFTF
jgi:hypothetical protein